MGETQSIPSNPRPSWEQYYTNLALHAGARSTCLRRRYGAIIVKDNRIVGTSYNGSARGEVNCTDRGTCKRQDLNVPPGERYELCEAVHAEWGACINSNPTDMVGATIYVAGTNADGSLASGKPCMMCERTIKNAQISKVVYLDSDGSIKEMKIGRA